MARDLSKPFECPSLDSYQKKLRWYNKEVNSAPHRIVGLVFRAGDAGKFPQAFDLKILDLFLSQLAGSTSHSHREGWR